LFQRPQDQMRCMGLTISTIETYPSNGRPAILPSFSRVQDYSLSILDCQIRATFLYVDAGITGFLG
jgi:hypothetical protein